VFLFYSTFQASESAVQYDVKNALFTTFIFAPVGAYRRSNICIYSAGHVTRFQPMRFQHFWWWDNNVPYVRIAYQHDLISWNVVLGCITC